MISSQKSETKGRSIKIIVIPMIVLIIGLILVFSDGEIAKSKDEKSKQDMEAKLCAMINDLNGISQANVMLLIDENGNVSGAAVICCGGDIPINQKSVIDLITSLFDVSTKDVFVGGR